MSESPASGETSIAPSVMLDAFLELMPDAAVVVDDAGVITSANAQADSLFGYEPGTLVALPIEQLVPERLRHRHRGHRTAFASSPTKRTMGANFSLTGRRRDGHEFPVDVSLAPIDLSGSTFVIAAVRDLTDQLAAVSAQIELGAVVRSSTDAMISTTIEGLIASWNPAAERLFRYAPDEILGRPVSTLVPDAEVVVLEELLDSATHGSHLAARDTKWRTSRGEVVDVAVSISPLRYQSEALTGFSFIVRDITERKRNESELRRLITEEEQFHRQHAAAAEIRLKLLSDAPLEESLTLICVRASELVGAPTAVICRLVGDSVLIINAVGPASELVGTSIPLQGSFAGYVITNGVAIASDHRSDRSNVVTPAALPNGPTLGVPIVLGGATIGSLSFVRDDDASPYSRTDRASAETLAAQVAIAFEFERARVDRERMMLTNDRERIARDLHDLVIQRLFAAGISLQSALPEIDATSTQRRVNNAIDQLDETIREIRNTIFSLSLPQSNIAELRDLVAELAVKAVDALGFEPTVRFVGSGEVDVPAHVVPHVVAVVREALSNVARHARATRVDVEMIVTPESIVVTVIDDGVGMTGIERSSGLSNLRSRADELGGTFTAESPTSGGTRLVWRAPLRRGDGGL